MDRRTTPVVIYGISGATWDRVDPLLAAGRMPNLRRLIDAGCRGPLRSARPAGDKHYRPQTAWPSVATGCDPDRHGVTRFYHRADDLRRPAVWDAFAAAGRRVGLFGWPITWPPPHVDGFVVPGYDGRDPATWPADLAPLRSLDRRQAGARGGRDGGGPRVGAAVGLVRTLVGHGARPGTLLRLAGTAASARLGTPAELRPLRTRAARLDVNVDLFARLCDRYRPSLMGFVTFLVDYASHRFWMFGDPARFPDAPPDAPPALRDAVDQAYADVDRALGRLLARVGRGAVVAVVSEHGMAAEPVSAEIGPAHWVLRPNAVRAFVGLDESVVAVPVARWIAFRPPPDRAADVAARFAAVRVARADVPLFQVYRHRDEVIVKLALARGGPVQAIEAMRVRSGDGREAPFTDVARRFGRRRSAMHAADGVLVLSGPGVRHGTVDGARVTDVAPTLLALAGLPPMADVDGRVLDGVGG